MLWVIYISCHLSKQKPIFCRYSNDVYNLSHTWHEFKMIELVEIMRQKDDQPFIELLNRLRVAQRTEAYIRTIPSRAVDVNDKNNYPLNELFPERLNIPISPSNCRGILILQSIKSIEFSYYHIL